jgi:hypothetical protein
MPKKLLQSSLGIPFIENIHGQRNVVAVKTFLLFYGF